MRFFSSTAPSLLAAILTVQVVKAEGIDWNCPSLKDGAIIRLRPCFKNDWTLSICANNVCGNNQSPPVTVRQLGQNELAYGEWRVIDVPSQTIPGNEIPKGHIRLRSEAPGMSAVFLAVESKNQQFDAKIGTTSTKVAGRQLQVASYVDNQNQTLFRWDRSSQGTKCRVSLRSLHAEKWMGIIRAGGPTIKDFSRPVVIYDDTKQTTNVTWEVEFVRQAPPPAARTTTTTAASTTTTAAAKAAAVTITTTTTTAAKGTTTVTSAADYGKATTTVTSAADYGKATTTTTTTTGNAAATKTTTTATTSTTSTTNKPTTTTTQAAAQTDTVGDDDDELLIF